ncbi:metal ABC transporter ATP-binding protein [Brevibacillus composti]|uniref:Metal ABC transporter ATP-binding protein n=1 Tax=Brevibacillus composti TaxID=2796470 RepID=A0A7T5EL28_9BACL|nr:metal ABC transporter ATP-binding protein [Brevibacillus composti]QQE74587.1 metal ABC transporter ATP-binding protein [Brevibacillus composti]QUO41670.1 metal ABC transporter ATP-binding protein [Brevibacillus composti]
MQRTHQTDTVVKLTSVSFQYETKTVLEDINFSLERGDFVGIVGPNGSGKSTLMKLLLGLVPATKGTVELFGQPLSKFRDWSKIGYVAQQAAHGTGGFPATVREVVSSGLVGKVGLFRRLQAKHHRQVEDVVERVGLTEKLDERIGNLSGGQLQRVFIARALVAEPELLILDEPTVGVDQESIEQFYELLRSLKEDSGMTMMIVSHDVGVMTQWVNKVACLQRKLHFHGTAHDFTHNHEKILQDMYGDSIKMLAHHH